MPFDPNDPFSQLDASQLQDEPFLKRYGKQVLRGATLGFAGAKYSPETVGEHVAEFAGGILPVAAISAVASPIAGAGLRLLNVPKVAIPLASRLITGGAVGAGTTAGYDISETGETSLGRVGLGTGLGIAQEALFLGAGRLARKAMAKPKPLIPEVSPTAGVTKDTIEEAIGTRELPLRREPLALPPMREPGITGPSGIFEEGITTIPGHETGLLPRVTRQVEEITRTSRTQGIFEIDKRTGAVKPVSMQVEQTKARFHVGRDPETGIPELISKDSLTDSAIDLASRPGIGLRGSVSISQLEAMNPKEALNLGWEKGREGGWMYVGIRTNLLNQEAKAKLDIVTRNEPLRTENILKQSDEIANKLLDPETPSNMADYVKLNYTPEAIEAMTIARKIGMDDATLTTMMEASQQIKGQIERNKVILDRLKFFCQGPTAGGE